MNDLKVSFFDLKDDGRMPNNPILAVVLYWGALKEISEQTEKVFNSHNWQNSWKNGVFDYHHYHSNVHEVLGVVSGYITLQIGGEQGKKLLMQKGDVIVLPAGTAHKKLTASSDFQVVGAYPNGMDYNLCMGKSEERPQVLKDIQQVPLPMTDPVYGDDGPLMMKWMIQ
jgi:uncharacterized protein YjlB